MLAQFAAILDEIRQKQYGTDFEEYALGIGCLAVPIYDAGNKPIAAIGLTGQIENYQDSEKFNEFLESLRNVSELIKNEIEVCSSEQANIR